MYIHVLSVIRHYMHGVIYSMFLELLFVLIAVELRKYFYLVFAIAFYFTFVEFLGIVLVLLLHNYIDFANAFIDDFLFRSTCIILLLCNR